QTLAPGLFALVRRRLAPRTPVGDSSLTGVVGRQAKGDGVAGPDANGVLAHLPREVGDPRRFSYADGIHHSGKRTPVTKPSFADLKQKFDLACTALRAFTLGRRGSTQRGGLAAVERVKGLCDLLKQLYGSGPHAKAAAALVVTGRFRISAAETRLALLRGRRGIA